MKKRKLRLQVVPGGEARLWLAEALAGVPRLGCHFPLGHTSDPEGFHFCGEPQDPSVASRFPTGAAVPPYCTHHYRVAYLVEGEDQAARDKADRKAKRGKST